MKLKMQAGVFRAAHRHASTPDYLSFFTIATRIERQQSPFLEW
jgi:hypothetical protein